MAFALAATSVSVFFSEAAAAMFLALARAAAAFSSASPPDMHAADSAATLSDATPTPKTLKRPMAPLPTGTG
ncbi:hypothetical protein GCM10023194_07930 [Planotetraspora phitsanulokensis]|uniref:Secreted protein n=1 Tax=Planotetraspora phitsanulokensis TaxID=575192 RepID=A0A8J3UAW4_9ACTN|nr:hypothetical protein Pph01_50240 [Planotetraspora phitsanulokensis]